MHSDRSSDLIIDRSLDLSIDRRSIDLLTDRPIDDLCRGDGDGGQAPGGDGVAEGSRSRRGEGERDTRYRPRQHGTHRRGGPQANLRRGHRPPQPAGGLERGTTTTTSTIARARVWGVPICILGFIWTLWKIS